MDSTKKPFTSGKLHGTKTFKSTLEEKNDLDNIEKFLLEFETFKIPELHMNYDNIKNIDSDEEFNELFINESKIGLLFSEDYSEIFISSESKHYIITTQNISHESLYNIFSNEKIVKYVLNAYTFLKWLGDKEIILKNVFDIPTYIKLLTNQVDPSNDINYYLEKFSNIKPTNEIEKNSIIISAFILQLGEYLNYYASKFEINTIANLLNQNAYYEVNRLGKKPVGNCVIEVKVSNFEGAINRLSNEILEKFKSKLYFISPLNRIIPKYKTDNEILIKESLIDDFSNTILNELYNDNIPVRYDLDYGIYKIYCKQKNITNIINVLQSTFYEVFYTIFDEVPELNLNCIIKYT